MSPKPSDPNLALPGNRGNTLKLFNHIFAGTGQAAGRAFRALTVAMAVSSFLLAAAEAQTPPSIMPHRLTRTNAAAATRPPAARPNPAMKGVPTPAIKPGAKPAPGTTNAVNAAKSPGTNAAGGVSFGQKFKLIENNPAFYPAVIGVIVLLLGLLIYKASKQKPAQPAGALVRAHPRHAGAASIQAANVLEVGPAARQVWQFDARGGKFSLNRHQTSLPGEGLPGRLVAKDWRGLFQRKLNVAWLPAEHVFLRVVHLPRSDFDETVSMVELQLEKLSPMPVAQIAWSLQLLPHAEGNLQTVVIAIVARSVVEEFLGKLEGEGFLADRLELPLLDQLQTTAITSDGAWIYPEAAGGNNAALVAWWYGGVLQNVDLLTLPPAGATRPALLKEQLMQMAWAGELEGWLKSPPAWHLVADTARAEWEPALREGLEQSIEVEAPLPPRELAALTARRAAQSDARVNLLPAEFVERYRQQFVDRLWMRGLVAVAAIYLAIVAVYMVALGYASWRTGIVEAQANALAGTYTNVVQLKTRFQVLKDRQDLKYAALDCWDAAANKLPENVTLDNLTFSDGRVLHLRGTAPADSVQQLFNFERDLRQYAPKGQQLFDPNKGETLQWRVQGSTASWTLGLELLRSEVQ